MNDLSFLFKLSPAERMQLAMDLWDSLPVGGEAMPALTDAQMAELDRRLAEHEKDPSSASDWADVKARLLTRRP